jgi:type IV secretion system protein VirB9
MMRTILPLGLLVLLSACAGHQLAECNGASYALNGEAVRPSVWDDGQQTYLNFPANAPIPSIFYMPAGDKQKATVASYTVQQDGTVIVHGVYPRIILRSGDAVACLDNESFNPVGYNPQTGTVSPDIVRMPAVTKGAAP